MKQLIVGSLVLVLSAGGTAFAGSHGGAVIKKLDGSQAPMTSVEVAKARAVGGNSRGSKTRRGLAGATAIGFNASGTFTHSRVEPDSTIGYAPNYNRTGKITLKRNGKAYTCTGALIRPGVVVTAAHCLSDFGKKAAGFATDVEFRPGYNGLKANPAPFGFWKATGIVVPDVHTNGTDTCSTNGRCNNDVGLVVLAANAGKLPGHVVGHYMHAVNGPTFQNWPASPNSYKSAQITVLGYSNGLDYGKLLQRTDATAYIQTNKTLNYATNSALSLGSDGGPWLVNFGVKPTLSTGATLGSQSDQYVVGVTQSYMNLNGEKSLYGTYFGVNKEYPSMSYGKFLGGNIAFLLNKTCTNKAFTAAC